MGCDIHVHVEVKIGDQWEHYGIPSVDRDYRLFAHLAGVRNYDHDEPVAIPRGIPEDATTLTKFHFAWMNGDAHTPSWLAREEVALAVKRAAKGIPGTDENRRFYNPFGYVFGNPVFRELPGYSLDELPEGIEDARIVFWFDN